MIQRIQTIWLLLAALLGFLMTQIPLFVIRQPNIERHMLAPESYLLFAVCIGLALLAAGCIFLFRRRPLQFRLSVMGVIIALILIALEIWKTGQYRTLYGTNLISSSYSWGALLPIPIAICFTLAARGIYKDEKLIKSQDRLR